VKRLRRILERSWQARRRRAYAAQMAEAEAILQRARDRRDRKHLQLVEVQ
jgi:hypothetical protein